MSKNNDQIQDDLYDNIRAQLNDDILSYEWLLAVAKHHFPEEEGGVRQKRVLKSVKRLIDGDVVIVGTGGPASTIVPWEGNRNELWDRVSHLVSEIGFPKTEEHRFCFWIGLPSSVYVN